jgi:hypothetical protein
LISADDQPTVDEDPPLETGANQPWHHRLMLRILGFQPDYQKFFRQSREGAPHVLRTFVFLDMRWSFFVTVILIGVGGIVQLFIPRGWSVWPVVFCGALLSMLDEASDRNGVGVPPLRVVAFVVGVLAAWLGLAMFLRVVPTIVPILGLGVTAYYSIRADLKRRQRRAVMAMRVHQGLCAYCGEEFEPGTIDCMHCGELVNPDGIRSTWSTRIAQSAGGVARTRAILKGEAGGVTARKKEQALLDRRYRPGKAKK